MNKTVTIHGGDLDLISRLYNIPKNEIIDFGGNVNPLGLPASAASAVKEHTDLLSAYPDVDYVELRSAISEYADIPAEYLMVGNGSTELISLFIKAIAPKKAVIVSPAYSEYKKEIELIGGTTELFPLKESDNYILDTKAIKNALDESVDMLVICNPNNPTGTYVDNAQAIELLEHCRQKGIYIMIDETYVEFAEPELKVSSMPLVADYDNLCVIRSTSKFFACPGLRLGYGATSSQHIKEYVLAHKDPWSVNVFAELCGSVMFRDKAFIDKARSFIFSERKRILNELSNFKNLKVYKTQSNFFLVKLIRDNITSAEVFEKLIKQKMLVRDAADFPYLNGHYIRFCIQTKENNDKLLKALKEIIE